MHPSSPLLGSAVTRGVDPKLRPENPLPPSPQTKRQFSDGSGYPFPGRETRGGYATNAYRNEFQNFNSPKP
jgi:hypothetical protein